MSDTPLEGIRVLELATMIAAPTTGALLADYGATVIKVERPGPGDLARKFGALDAEGVSWYWRSLARGKKLDRTRSARSRDTGPHAALDRDRLTS